MKTEQHDWTSPITQTTARAALALHGEKLNEADGTAALLESRNACRRVIATLRDKAVNASQRNDAKAADAFIDQMEAVGEMAKRAQTLLDCELENDDSARGAGSWVVNGQRVRAMRTGADFRAHYSRLSNAAGDIDIASFMRGVAGLQSNPDVRAALSEGTDSAGGYSVPSLVMPAILEAMVPASTVLTAGASILPLDNGSKTYTAVALDTIPTAAWRSEAAAISESDPAFRGVVITPRSCAFRFAVSRELLMDGVGIEAALTQAIAQSFARELDRVALRGSGTPPEPRGILNTTNVNAVTNGAAGASLLTTAYANFMTATQLILEDDAPLPSAAIMSPRSLVVLGGLLDTTNQPRAKPQMLAGMQMLATSQIPNNLTVTTSSDCSEIYLGSFDRLVYGMRESVSIQKLSELYAANGQIGFVGHIRADVATLYPKAFAVCTGVRP